MKKLEVAIIGVCLAGAMSASAAITITTEGTMAPNAFGSPSFNTWAGNALEAALNGYSSYGTPGPAQFNVVTSPLPVSYNIATGFQSWLGQAPGPYAGELGNRATFVGVINGNGDLININQLGLTLSQNANGGDLNYTYPTFAYSTANIGIIFNNGNNISGGYTIVTSGSQDVNEIVTFHGNTYAAYGTDPGATDQDKINNALAGIDPYALTGTYTYGVASGSATMVFGAVPEPTTVVAGALLLLPFGISTLRLLRSKQTE